MTAKDIKRVVCYGAGTIGGSFAAFFSLKGLRVTVFVRSDESAQRARRAIQTPIDAFVAHGFAGSSGQIWESINITTDPVEAFSDCQFIQENGEENYEAKQHMLGVVDKYAPPDAIFATSSSGLLVSEMARLFAHPERCIGAHPFNPAHFIPLIEITKGEKTSKAVIDTAVEFYRSVGKEPIVLQKEMVGFVANRLAHALWREEIALVCEGVVTLEECDKAICYGPGLRWAIFGPAMHYELGGGELGLRGCAIKFGAMTNMVFEDISDMKKVPEEWADLSGEQIIPIKEHMPDFVGHNNEDIARFRDYMLVEILKMHNKF